MLNKVQLIGRAGNDPDSRIFPSGDQQVTLSLATTKRWRNKETGEKKEKTSWHNLVFKGGLAKVAEDYLHKGSLLFVGGEIDYQEWEKDGVKKYKTCIFVSEMHILDGKPEGTGGTNRATAPRQAQRQEPSYDDFNDGIPF